MAKKSVYVPPLSVWKVIEDSASPEKHAIIRSLVGISKLEYATDLRNELETLIEIWSELNSDSIPARFRPQTHLGLPEPPKQREMLVTEIHLLLENLRDKENGGLGFIPNDCSEDVINYTNHIIDQRTPTPTTPRLRGTPSSVLNDDEIVDVAKNMPVLDNESPIEVLRNALQCECDILSDDIEYVRRCVEEGRCDFEELPAPSLQDLKDERKKLESHLIKSIEINPTVNPSLTQNRNSRKKGIPTIRPSTPVPKRKNLPPVRPSSAVQYSTVIASKKEITQCDKKEALETLQPEIPLLGNRSHTDPSGNVIKISARELRRRNSTSSVPLCRASSEHETIPDKNSVLEHEVVSYRKQCGIFCGTPDSGVSSRPVSGLGIDELTISDGTEVAMGLSEFRTTSNPAQLDHLKIPRKTVDDNIHTNASYQQSVLNCNIKSPQPPIRPRPPMHGRRSMQSAKFRKIKVSAYGDL